MSLLDLRFNCCFIVFIALCIFMANHREQNYPFKSNYSNFPYFIYLKFHTLKSYTYFFLGVVKVLTICNR